MKKVTTLLFLLIVVTVLCSGIFLYSVFNQKNKDEVFVCGVSEQTSYCTKNPQKAIELGYYPNKTGELLYKANCKSCHSIKRKSVGPALEVIHTEGRPKEWLYAFIKNPSQMINDGDSLSVALYEEYKVLMTSFPNLEEAEIDSIIAYIKHESISQF